LLALIILVVGMLAATAAYADVITYTEAESVFPTGFVGTWTVYGGEEGLSGGFGVYSRTADNTFSFPFKGTGIDWMGVIAPTCGQADVWVNGETPVPISLYVATQPEYGKTLWTRTGLPDGDHVLNIRVHGTGNINVDRLAVHTPDPVVVSTPASSPWSLALLALVGVVGAAGAVSVKKRLTA
jgi:hypothetical protein